MSMKLHYVTGCICDSLSVEGKEFNEMSLEEQREILHKLVDNADGVTLQQMFIEYMEDESEWHTSGPCECCGDLVEYYKLEI